MREDQEELREDRERIREDRERIRRGWGEDRKRAQQGSARLSKV